MSLPDPVPARKPRRLGLYLPFILALIVALAWSGLWVWARSRTVNGLDAAAESLRAAGYEVAWKSRTVDGYPFRLNVVLNEASLREPSGWGVSTPRLEAESFLHGLGHWVMATPDGLAVARPKGGVVEVTGEVIRASLNHLDQRPPSLSVEAVKLAFAPAPGARPFALTSADKVEMHLRAGPDDQGAFLLRVDGGKADAAGVLGRVAGDAPVALIWESTLSRMSAFEGRGWAAAAAAWSGKGGTITLRQAGLTAGDALLGVKSGSLSAGGDGRLRGELSIELRKAALGLDAMAASGLIPPEAANAAAAVVEARQGAGGAASADLVFQAGRTTLGPVALGPAPRLF